MTTVKQVLHPRRSPLPNRLGMLQKCPSPLQKAPLGKKDKCLFVPCRR